KIVIKKEEPQ
ncbi:hypothetical protein VCHENC02_1091, partial [Vibrio harveyi]